MLPEVEEGAYAPSSHFREPQGAAPLTFFHMCFISRLFALSALHEPSGCRGWQVSPFFTCASLTDDLLRQLCTNVSRFEGRRSHLFSHLMHNQVFKCDTFALLLIICRVILVQRVIPGTEPADGPPKAKQLLAGNNPKCTGNNSLVGRRSHLFSHLPHRLALSPSTSALTSQKRTS